MNRRLYLGLAAIAFSQQPTKEVPLDFRNCQRETKLVRGEAVSGNTCEVTFSGRRLGHAISIEAYQGPDTSLARYLRQLKRANEVYSPEQMQQIITTQSTLGVADRDPAVACEISTRYENPARSTEQYTTISQCFFIKTKVKQLPEIKLP